MPSAKPAPLKQRLHAAEARDIATKKEPQKAALEGILRSVLEEQRLFEEVEDHVNKLRWTISEKQKAVAAEEAKVPPEVPDQQAIQQHKQEEERAIEDLKSVKLEELEARAVKLDRSVRAAKKDLEVFLKDFDRARNVLLAEARIKGTPPSVLGANDVREHTLAKREDLITEAKERTGMEGVEAVEQVIGPFLDGWKGIFAKVDATKLRTGLNLPQENYIPLDYAKARAIADAFKRLKNGQALSDEVWKRLQDYQLSLRALKADEDNIHKHLPALEKAMVDFSTIPQLLEPDYTPDRMKAVRVKFQPLEVAILDKERPEVIKVEAGLVASLTAKGDDARLIEGLTAEVLEVPDKQREALFEKLTTPERVNAFVLDKLAAAGIPMTKEGLKQVMDKRRMLAQRLSKSTKIEDAQLLHELRADILFTLFGGADLIPEDRDAIKDRLADLGWMQAGLEPRLELGEVLLHGMRTLKDATATPPTELPPEENRTNLQKVIDEYFALIEDTTHAPSSAKMKKYWESFVGGNDLQVIQLLNGEMLKDQQAKKIADVAVLRKPPEYYFGLLAKVEGIPVLDPVAVKAAETRKVKGFLESMERAEVLKKELIVLQKTQAELAKSPTEGKEILERSRKARADLATIEARRRDIFTYLLKRDMAFGDEDTTERKRLADNWPVSHPAEISAKEAAATAAARAHTLALEDAQRAKDSGERRRLIEEIRQVEALEAHLRQVTLGGRQTEAGLQALEQNKAEYEVHLRQLPAFTVDGKKYKAEELIAMVQKAESIKPFGAIRAVLPASVKSLDLNRLYGGGAIPAEVINAEYEFINDGSRAGIALANWFSDNYPATGVAGRVISFLRPANKAWEDEVRKQTRIALAELQKAFENAELAHREMEAQSQQAHDLREPGRDKLAEQVSKLRLRKNELKKLLGTLREQAVNLQKLKTDEVLQLAYDALHQVTRQVTGKEELKPALSKEAFKGLANSMSAVRPDPVLIQRLVDACEEQKTHIVHLLAQFSVIAGKLTSGAEINLPVKRQMLAEKDADIVLKEQTVEEKRLALEAALAEVARVKAETLDERLAAFDDETSQHISTKLDPEGMLTKEEYDEHVLQKNVNEVGAFRAKVLERFAEVARLYREWLDQRAAMVAARIEETETEKAAFVPVDEEGKKIFALFEAHGAKPEMTGAQFDAWYTSLTRTADKFKVLVNGLVPGLL